MAAAWKNVINADGVNGQSPACSDLTEFAKVQEGKFVEVLVDAFEAVEGGSLSGGAREEIEDTIDMFMDKVGGGRHSDGKHLKYAMYNGTLLVPIGYVKLALQPLHVVLPWCWIFLGHGSV